MTKEKDGLSSLKKQMIAAFILVGGLGVVGIVIMYEVDTSINWPKIHADLTTNQTFISGLNCTSIGDMQSAASVSFFVDTHQITNDLNILSKEKSC